MFVGVGAARVRDLFEQAEEAAPGDHLHRRDRRHRQGAARRGVSAGHDEREQTLNQMLAEIDGFEPRDGVIVMAATNRPDVLDPALLRPGASTAGSPWSCPTARARGDPALHARGKPLADVDLDAIAGLDAGHVRRRPRAARQRGGAARGAPRAGNPEHRDFVDAIERILLGTERQSC